MGAGSGFGGVVDSYRLVRKRGGAEDLEGTRVGRRRKNVGEGLIARARERRARSAGLKKWFVVLVVQRCLVHDKNKSIVDRQKE